MTDTVVLTASAGAFPGLAAALGRIRVAIEERPLMSFAPPANGGPLDAALERLGEYGSIAFTSPRAAHAVARRMKELAVGWPPVRSTPVVWATGPATAAGLGGGMGSVRLPAGRRTGRIGAARALGRAMVEKQASGPVLFPCGESHRDELPLELRAGGLSVDEVVCYRSVLAAIAEARMAAERGTVLVVTSPSVADLVARACPRGTRPELLAVGPTTAETARAAGWSPAAVATEPTARALASAIKSLLRKR